MTFSRRVAAAFLPLLAAIPLAAISSAALANPQAVTIGVDSYKFTPNPRAPLPGVGSGWE